MQRIVAALLLGAATAVAVASCGAPEPSPSSPPSASTSPAPSSSAPLSPSPSPSPSASPAAIESCIPPTGTLPPAYAGDPCPAVLTAVHAAVADLGLSVERIHVEQGPFQCGDLWPGIGTPPVCFMALIVPGADMHGWVSFFGSDKVAAVQLSRARMPEEATPPPSPLPWTVRVLAFEAPPAGWTLP